MPTASKLPSPNEHDSEQVALCLQTAERLAKNGDLPDAIRWLRRGAEAAEQDGNDERAAVLAGAAADLSSHAGQSVAAPVPSASNGASAPVPAQPTPAPPSVSQPPPPSRAAPRMEPRPSAAPPPPPARVASPQAAVSTQPVELAQLAELVSQGRAVRVSIKRSARDPGLYVVRHLDESKPLPFGVRAAVLVLPESDPEFLSAPPARK